MSKVYAHWESEIINKAIAMIRERGNKTLLIGNGDVPDMDDARKKVQQFGVDGVMIGISSIYYLLKNIIILFIILFH